MNNPPIQIIRFGSLASTNLEAAERAIKGAPEGVCIVAAEQTAGRGRLERHWISPKDAGLYFSIILRPTFEQKFWPLITLMSAIAVHDALLEACQLRTDIKWPNDVLFKEKKLSGILAETFDTPSGRAVVVGIGINLTSDSFPPELSATASSVEEATGKRVDHELLLNTLVSFLNAHYDGLKRPEGPDSIIECWRKRSSYAEGKQIRVTESNNTFSGTTRGLEADGALRVQADDGTMKIVRAGDVTAIRPV